MNWLFWRHMETKMFRYGFAKEFVLLQVIENQHTNCLGSNPVPASNSVPTRASSYDFIRIA